MIMIWTTSDQHFLHKAIIRYCNRPFNDVKEMNEVMIEKWNSVVKQDDLVIHCGDLCMGTLKDIEKKIVPRLNGKLLIIKGNHDKAAHRRKLYNRLGIEVIPSYIMRYKGILFGFNHKPIDRRLFFKERKEEFRPDILMCYGHIHQYAPKGLVNNSFHVGVDTNDFTPVSLDYIVELANSGNS